MSYPTYFTLLDTPYAPRTNNYHYPHQQITDSYERTKLFDFSSDIECSKKDEEINRLRNELKRLENQWIEDNIRLKDEMKEKIMCKDEADKMCQVFVKYINRSANLSAEKAKIHEKLNELQNQLNENQKDIEIMNRRHSEIHKRLDANNRSLETQVNTLKKNLSAKEIQIKENLKKTEDLEKKLEANKVKLIMYKSKYDLCRTEFMATEKDFLNTLNELKLVKNENSSLRQQREYFQVHNETHVSELYFNLTHQLYGQLA